MNIKTMIITLFVLVINTSQLIAQPIPWGGQMPSEEEIKRMNAELWGGQMPSEEEMKRMDAELRSNNFGDFRMALPRNEDFGIFSEGKQAVPLRNNQLNDGIAMFPQAEKNEQRFIIKIDTKPNQKYKLELTAGIRKVVDCNTHGIEGGFSINSLGGWGYPYYTFKSKGLSEARTLMACPSLGEKRLLNATPTIVNYNKKLPLIVYIPKGYELHYRVFSSDKLIKAR
jgi:ecotin